MKKLFKLIIALLLLILIAALVAPQFISKEMIKKQLIAEIEAATGRKLTLGGEVGLRLLPAASVSLHDAVLSGAGKTSALTIKTLRVEVAWLPLLHGKIDITRFLVEAPLGKSSDGKLLMGKIEGAAQCTRSACNFPQADIELAENKAKGSANINFSGSKPNVKLKLVTDRLDVTPFLPPEPQKTAQISVISEAQAAAGWNREPMDFSGLDAIDAHITVDSKVLLVRKIRIEQATLNATIENGHLKATVVDASLYNGKGSFSVKLDSVGNIQKEMSLVGVQAQPFLMDAMNEGHISGTADMQMVVSAKGKSAYDMVQTLSGNGRIKFSDGAIQGIDIANMVRNIQSAFKNVDTSSQKTDFAELGGTFTIAGGIIKNNDLAMKAPLLRLSGAGQVNLPERTISYRLKPEIVQTMQGQGGKEKQGLGVPIIIEGDLDNLHWRPDASGIIEDALKDPQKLEDTVKNIGDQFKGENKKETLRNIRGLFKH